MPGPSIGPKLFWTIQIVLVRSKLFWSGPNHFGQVQIRLSWTNLYNLDPTKNELDPTKIDPTKIDLAKTNGLDQNHLNSPKSFWIHRSTRHWTKTMSFHQYS